MGSLDILGAKQQFLQLVDSLNSSHLPGFTIWLDTKLAEYKVIGTIEADSQEAQAQQYPEWISRSLRQNLSFIFQGDKDASSTPPKPVPKQKRRFSGGNSGEVHTKVRRTGGSEDQVVTHSDIPSFVIKEEVSSDNEDAIGLSEVSNAHAPNTFSVESSRVTERPMSAETPLPTVQESFSLRPPHNAIFPDQTELAEASVSTSFSAPIFPQPQPYVSPIKPHFPVHELSDQVQSQQVQSAKVEQCGSPILSGAPTAEEGTASSTSSQGPNADNAMPPGDDPLDVPRIGKNGRVLSSAFKYGDRHSCPQCKMPMKSQHHLKVHLRIHTGEKPYKCPYCSMRFNRDGNCYSHQRAQHPDLPLEKVWLKRKPQIFD